ncbi:EI24 domain-containing protein [Sulfurimonas sp. SAG-AH-194-I05]|nr:EI24 domain-containing protein [Sulfurimonas sp. SAG-AH-194-I05]MDF1875680.1 EI24 domain-containing protein [Sulfurimonas sp. SAG-AH-194-I05]
MNHDQNQNLLALSLQDFFSAQMLKYAFLPFIISMIIMYILFFTLAGVGLDALTSLGSLDVQTSQTSIENGIPHTETLQAKLEGMAIIQFLMTHAITSWIATFLIFAIGGFVTLYISIIVAILVIGFLTPYVLKELHLRHYEDLEMLGYSNIFTALGSVLKWAFIMLLLFFLMIPLYFIPVVNIIAFNFPLYYFFHKVMTYDIATNMCTKEEDYIMKYKFGGELRFKTLLLYLISLIPFAIFFGAIFYVIYLGNTYFLRMRVIRKERLL